MIRFFYSAARLLAWVSALSRGLAPVRKRGQNRVIMRGAGRVFKLRTDRKSPSSTKSPSLTFGRRLVTWAAA